MDCQYSSIINAMWGFRILNVSKPCSVAMATTVPIIYMWPPCSIQFVWEFLGMVTWNVSWSPYQYQWLLWWWRVIIAMATETWNLFVVVCLCLVVSHYSLGHNRLTDTGARVLATALQHNKSLEELKWVANWVSCYQVKWTLNNMPLASRVEYIHVLLLWQQQQCLKPDGQPSYSDTFWGYHKLSLISASASKCK